MNTIRILDGCCKAGGCSVGYHRAFTETGIDVQITGVDIEPQPRYPYRFVQDDILAHLGAHGWEYDFIHVSPPCQRYSSITKTAGTQDRHPDLIAPVRFMLQTLGKPYVIENVPGARHLLHNPIMLCGTMFGLLVQRHRYFETSFPLWFTDATCNHHRKVVKHGRKPDPDVHFAAATGNFSGVAFVKQAMGIDWMIQRELKEAIPPAYTHWLGKQVVAYLRSSQPAIEPAFSFVQMAQEAA